jgi:RimJ/RimL family protein N-acetyltransferase
VLPEPPASSPNAFDQPLGAEVGGWTPRSAPPREPIAGRYCRVEPLDAARHAADLFAANALDREGRNWTYLPYGPFHAEDDYRRWVASVADRDDPQFHAVVDLDTGRAAGVASYLRIDRDAGSIEVGHINYSPLLQRRRAATEAMYLMMQRVFDLGYRRYEWKCNALNAASRAAAERLGFSYEGTFRQARVVKGRNRDTAWYAAIDAEWPALDRAFRRWLDPANFDAQGRQRISLRALTARILVARG